MAKLRIRYTKSAIGYSSRQKETIRSLGLHKLQSVVIHDDTPAIRGMAFHVRHLVTLEEIDEAQIEVPKRRAATTIVLKASEVPEPQGALATAVPAVSPMPVPETAIATPAMGATVALEEPVVPSAPVAQPTVALSDAAVAEAPALEQPVADHEDLEIVEGIGPKIADKLREAGIHTFAQLAEATPETLEQILRTARLYGGLSSMPTWGEQAALAAAEKWDELKALQERLNAGRETEGATE